MKILYIANERHAAALAAHALRGIAQNVTLTWAPTLDSARHWLDGNRDAGAVIVEAEVQGQGCVPFVDRVGDLGLTVPIVVVTPEGVAPPAAALEAGADHVGQGDAFEADLLRVLTGAIERTRPPARETVLEGRLAESEKALTRESRICTLLQQRLLELEAALRSAQEQRASDAAVSADQLAKRHAEFTAGLTQAAQWRDALAQKLSAAMAALDQARQARTADAAAAADHLARREAELGAALSDALAAKSALEHTLTTARAALHDIRQRASADQMAAARRQAALEDRLARETADRTALEGQLADALAERQDAEHQHASELAAAAMRLADVQAEYDAALATHAAERDAFDRQLADAAAALEAVKRERASESTAAAERLARREAELGGALAEAMAARAALEHAFAEAEAAHRVARERASADLAAAADRHAALDERLNQETALCQALERDLAESRLQTARARRRFQHVVSAHRRRGREQKARFEAQLTRERAESERTHEQLRLSLDQLRTAFQTLEQIASEHAIERAKLESVVAAREGELNAQAARHAAAQQAAQDALGRETARFQQEIKALREELDASRAHANALRSETERIPVLQTQLDQSQKEKRRQFERAPYGLCHCTEEGIITDVNHSVVKMLGYRKADDLRGADFATVFEGAGDFRWLIERSVKTGKTETVETTLKTTDRRRLAVRLQALAAADGCVEIVLEDLTALRALEQRLRQAERMEAVGRLASEVAVTCDRLLRDVTRDAQEWLAATDADGHARHHGEQLLADVTRAATFLRRLAVYGDKQMNALEPVSVQRVLRDLEPVLKRVVGDDIDLVLPKGAVSSDVDVDADRVERVLVNAASYARERMPYGGQVRIDVATAVIGRKFIARYPNVRPGAHVLITVTEAKRAPRPDLRTALNEGAGTAERGQSAGDKPGVDLGALLELIGKCGGHLWMEAEPAGNMTLKIHLPKRIPEGAADSAAPAPRSNRGAQLTRWLRSGSPVATAGS